MITLSELKTQARDRADMANSVFVSDTELTSYINSSLAELYDLLVAAYGDDYYVEDITFATDGSMSYELPNGINYNQASKFYKLRGLDSQTGGDDWATVKRFNFNRRNENTFSQNLVGLPFLEYRLVGSNIRFNRTPDANTTIRLWYIPAAPVLVADDDSYDDINGFAEYIIVDSAIKMLNKEESDVATLLVQKQALLARIEAMAANRDANEPESVTDVYAEDTDIILGRS